MRYLRVLAHLTTRDACTFGGRSFDPSTTINGVLGGLVAITASSLMVETHGALIIGLVSAALVFYGSKLLLKVQVRYYGNLRLSWY